jgi:hypothetical protein
VSLPKMLDRLPDGVVVEIKVCIHESGSLSVQGPMDDKPWMIAALENAIDALRNQRGPRDVIVPSRDVSLP